MKLRYTLAALALTMGCGNVHAQSLQSAYFLDGYVYGHELNPAKDFERQGYVSFPFLGNLSMGINGNLCTKDLFYTQNGKLVTYLHPDISTEKALSNFKDINKFNEEFRVGILSVGFHALGGYNTFGIALRQTSNFYMPRDLFAMTKELQNKNYDLESFGGNASAYTEFSLGHSRQIIEGVRVGAKAKMLLGIAYAEAKFDKLNLNLVGENQWTVDADAQINVHAKGFSWGQPKTDELNNGQTYQHIDFDNVEYESSQTGLSGFGLAADLGAEVDFGVFGNIEGLKASISATDIGYIKWNEGVKAVNNGEQFVFDGFNNIQVKDGTGEPIEDQTDDFGDRLTKLYYLKDGGTSAGTTSSLGTTLRVGVEYEFPLYRRLSFGFLSTNRIQEKTGWTDNRISATVSPLSWLEASANIGVGTFGTNFGWIVNIHPRGFNFFVGMDNITTAVSKQYIPLGSNATFSMGINFPFGSSQGKASRKRAFDKLENY